MPSSLCDVRYFQEEASQLVLWSVKDALVIFARSFKSPECVLKDRGKLVLAWDDNFKLDSSSSSSSISSHDLRRPIIIFFLLPPAAIPQYPRPVWTPQVILRSTRRGFLSFWGYFFIRHTDQKPHVLNVKIVRMHALAWISIHPTQRSPFVDVDGRTDQNGRGTSELGDHRTDDRGRSTHKYQAWSLLRLLVESIVEQCEDHHKSPGFVLQEEDEEDEGYHGCGNIPRTCCFCPFPLVCFDPR